MFLDGYLKAKDMGGFDAVVKRMMEIRDWVLTLTWRLTVLELWGYARSRNALEPRSCSMRWFRRGLSLKSASYNALISGFCEAGDLETAKEVLDRMVADGLVSPHSFA